MACIFDQTQWQRESNVLIIIMLLLCCAERWSEADVRTKWLVQPDQGNFDDIL